MFHYSAYSGYSGYSGLSGYSLLGTKSRSFSNTSSSYISNSLYNDYFHDLTASTYISSKNNAIFIHFDISQFNISEFRSIIDSTIPKGFVYTVFVKVRYDYDPFIMAGNRNQFGFTFNSSYKHETEQLFSIVISRLKDYFYMYKLSEQSIVYILLRFRQKNKKLLSEFSVDKPSHISKFENILTEKNLTIPVSINEDYIGKPLLVNISNGFITYIYLTINNNQINFLDVIKDKAKLLRSNHMDNITTFDQNLKFYLLKDKFDYVLTIKILGDSSIEKIRYSTQGVVISHVTDNAVNNLVVRNSDEKQVVLEGDKIVSIKQNIITKAIEKPDSKALFV